MRHSYIAQYGDIKIVPLTATDSKKYRMIRNELNVRKWFEHKDIISKTQQDNWYKIYLDNSSDLMFSIYRGGYF